RPESWRDWLLRHHHVVERREGVDARVFAEEIEVELAGGASDAVDVADLATLRIETNPRFDRAWAVERHVRLRPCGIAAVEREHWAEERAEAVHELGERGVVRAEHGLQAVEERGVKF